MRVQQLFSIWRITSKKLVLSTSLITFFSTSKTFYVHIGIWIDSRLFILKLLKGLYDIWKKTQQIYFDEPTEVVSNYIRRKEQ